MESIAQNLGPVRDQGERATCLSMALSDGHGAVRNTAPLAADYLHAYAVRRCGSKINDAVSVLSALETLQLDGQPPEAEVPYSATARPDGWLPDRSPNSVYRNATTHQRSQWSVAIQELTHQRPVVLILEIDGAFCTGAGISFDEPRGTPFDRHAVLAIGYRADSIRIRNSWGAGWCDAGLAWLSQQYFDVRCTEVLTFGTEP